MELTGKVHSVAAAAPAAAAAADAADAAAATATPTPPYKLPSFAQCHALVLFVPFKSRSHDVWTGALVARSQNCL